jgi:AraC-like DNA-binding protein
MKPFRRYFTFTRYFYRLKGYVNEDPDHCHPQYEILYFHKASGEYVLGDQIINVQAGDLLVMNGLARHWPIKANGEDYMRTILVFDPNLVQLFHSELRDFDPLLPFKQLRNVHLRLSGESKQECEHILHKINRFYRKSDDAHYFRFLMAFLDLLLFVYIQSWVAFPEKHGDFSEKEHQVQKVMEYIESHYMEDIRLEHIEAYTYISKYHLTKIFREITGSTIFEYLFSRRINQAKILFYQNKEISVTDVCYQVGFKHLAHFSRMFKKQVCMSPDQYRKYLHQL